jgi:hypothetical protein
MEEHIEVQKARLQCAVSKWEAQKARDELIKVTLQSSVILFMIVGVLVFVILMNSK